MQTLKATLLVQNNDYPVPVSFAKQEDILSRTSSQQVISYQKTIEQDRQDMRKLCAAAEIDFEFVLDSSGSIGIHNWELTTDLIAEYWVRQTIQPSKSPQCGNHVAIRRYSSSHYFDLDFTSTADYISNGFTNYTDYVANVFENLPYRGGGTDTAGALERVRTEDINKFVSDTKYVMVFTDGQSNDVAATKNQAQLLHPLVDRVYSFGIGQGRNETTNFITLIGRHYGHNLWHNDSPFDSIPKKESILKN